ncbi:MAG: hypothetical protein Q7V58_13305 [Actinomycetota bacterium]|nr:hypothetical protein [Actinomycetota bacterium]
MCLSPQFDVVAGLAISVVAIDALWHCRNPRLLGLAALPAIFAVHTFSSAAVWLGLQGSLSATVLDVATASYLFVAFVMLPVYLPLAILVIEPRGWRRPTLLLLTAAGGYAAVEFMLAMASGRGSAVACDGYIDFSVASTSSYSAVLYVLATCGALLLSGQRILFIWGVTNIVAVGALSMWASRGLPSLWCLWAACSSVFVAWYLRRLTKGRAAGNPWPWEPVTGGLDRQRRGPDTGPDP